MRWKTLKCHFQDLDRSVWHTATTIIMHCSFLTILQISFFAFFGKESSIFLASPGEALSFYLEKHPFMYRHILWSVGSKLVILDEVQFS